VSRHLARLKRAGLVDARRNGKWTHYRWAQHGDPLVRRVLEGLRQWMAKDEAMNGERHGAEKFAAELSKETKEKLELMKTNEFISELRAAPQNRLLFIDANGTTYTRVIILQN